MVEYDKSTAKLLAEQAQKPDGMASTTSIPLQVTLDLVADRPDSEPPWIFEQPAHRLFNVCIGDKQEQIFGL
ncbi:MAG: hypothetical protein AAGF11_02520 [Myxococcota bacterium]